MASPTDRSLEALRKILLQEDEIKLKQLETELSRLRQQIADKESLIESLDPVIADLLERKIASSKQEMAAALAPVMSEAIRHQIAEAKDDVVDALYPIIGKTIRKSVAEAMKKLADSINQKIEQALRRGGFKKRLQAKLTGISEGELVLKESLPFQIQQMFLIHKDSGLLLSHVTSSQAAARVDEELISGMLTAIRNFVTEAFVTDNKTDLNVIQTDDFTIIVEPASYFYLALVITGSQPDKFKDEVQTLIRKIHNRFYKSLRYFDGDIAKFGEMPRLLVDFLRKYEPPAQQITHLESSRPRFRWAWTVAAIAIMALIMVFLPRAFFRPRPQERPTPAVSVDDGRRQQAVIAQLEQWIEQQAALRDSKVKLLIDGEQIIMEGTVPDQKIKRELGFMVSEASDARIVINNLEIAAGPGNAVQRAQNYLAQCRIYFPANQVTIADQYYSRLDSVVAMIMNVPGSRLIVKGYSDNSAAPAYNLALSRQRAQRVADYLIQRGLDQARIVVQSYGEAEPGASNDTELGRAKNRRVAFDLVLE